MGHSAPPSPGGQRFEPPLAVSTSDTIQPYLTETARLLGLLIQPVLDVMLQMSVCLSCQCWLQACADRLAFVWKGACMTWLPSPCSWVVVQLAKTYTKLGRTGRKGSAAVWPCFVLICLSRLFSTVFHPVSGNTEEEELLLFIVPVIWGRKAFTG